MPGSLHRTIVLLAVMVPPQACAQANSSALTLQEALALAERAHPRLRGIAAAVEGAEAGVTSARARPNPAITFGVLGRQRALIDSAAPGMLHGFAVNQPLELPVVRRRRIEAAEHGRESSRHALREVRLAVHGAVKQAYYEVLRRRREIELARGNVQLLEDLRRRIEVQVQAGEAGRMELIRADAELAASRIQAKSAELRRAAALAGLYAAIGAPLGATDVADSQLDPGENLPALDVLREQVAAAHPGLALAESETRRAGAALEYQKLQRMPQPTVWADVFRQPDVAQFRYGISVDLPVWNRREGPIAEAAAAQRQASAAAAQRRVEIIAALDRAYNMYQLEGQQLEMFEAGTLRQAEAALKAAEAAFRFGERSIIEVFDAQRVLRAVRFDYLNAQFDRQQALIELEQLGAVNLQGGKP